MAGVYSRGVASAGAEGAPRVGASATMMRAAMRPKEIRGTVAVVVALCGAAFVVRLRLVDGEPRGGDLRGADVAAAGPSVGGSATAAGPDSAGPTAVTRDAFADRAASPTGGTTLRARFLLDGAPFPDADVSADFARRVGEKAETGGDVAVTGRDGVATFPWPFPAGATDEGRATFRGFAESGGLAGEAVVALPAWLDGGTHELGDVELGGAAILVAGVVVDDAGTPVAGATVAVGRPGLRRGPFGVPSFAPADGLHAVSDAAGAFAVRGAFSGAEFLVRADRDGYFASTPTPASPGLGGLRLVLERRATIPARFVYGSEPLAGVTIVLSARLPDADPAGASAATVEFDGSASGALIGLRPATYDVEMRAAGANARGAAVTGSPPLCVVRGVAARPGPAKADPRLDPCDLATLVRRVRLRLLDAEGRPTAGRCSTVAAGVGEPEVELGSWPPTSADLTPVAVADADGMATLLLPVSGADVFVCAERHAPRVLRGVTTDADVPLVRAPWTRIEPIGGAPKDGGPYRYRIELEGRSADGYRWTYRAPLQGSVFLPATGPARCRFAALPGFTFEAVDALREKGIEVRLDGAPSAARTPFVDVRIEADPDAPSTPGRPNAVLRAPFPTEAEFDRLMREGR